MPGTRKLGRTSDHRKAMLRAMVTFLFETGKIETTATRAKEVRAMAEKMVTLGKREDLHAKRQVYGFITKESVAGTLESSDAMVYASPNPGGGRLISINSSVGQQFAPQIKASAEAVLNRLNIADVALQIEDKGALDCVLQARVKAALLRAGAEAGWEDLL